MRERPIVASARCPIRIRKWQRRRLRCDQISQQDRESEIEDYARGLCCSALSEIRDRLFVVRVTVGTRCETRRAEGKLTPACFANARRGEEAVVEQGRSVSREYASAFLAKLRRASSQK